MLTLMPSPMSWRIAGRPGAGRRHLDHEVVAADRAPQPPRLGDRRLGVHRQIGRDFEADVAVRAASVCVVDRAQHVGGVLDVLDRQPLVERHDIEVARAAGCPSARNRSRRCRAIAFSKIDGLEVTPVSPSCSTSFSRPPSRDETARQKVEPHGLPVIVQGRERIGGDFRWSFELVLACGFIWHSFGLLRSAPSPRQAPSRP